MNDYIATVLGGSSSNRDNNNSHQGYYEKQNEAPAIDIAGLSVLSIDLVPSGTYRPEFLRPYMVSTTREDLNALSDTAIEHNGRVSDTLIAGAAGKLMNYSTTVNKTDLVTIENGFDTKRFSFMIDVIEREYNEFSDNAQEIVTTISGYSDRIDIAHRSRLTRGTSRMDKEVLLAPDTVFYITNITRVNRANAMIHANNQIIVPSYYRENSINDRHNDLYIARPKDVFVIAGTEAAAASGRYGDSVHVSVANKLMGTMPKPSRSSNLTPASYLSSAINALHSSEGKIEQRDQFGGFGSNKPSREVVLRNASGLLRETVGYEANTFMTLLRDKVSSFNRETKFTWGDLHKIFGYDAIEDIATVHNFDMKQTTRTSNVGDDIADWDDRENGGRNSVLATILKQAVPAFAFESGILGCKFEATNSITRDQQSSAHNGIHVLAYDIIWNNRYTEAEQDQRIRDFEQNLAVRVLLDASIDNAFQFDISADVEWRFDSFYRIGIDNGRMMEYTSAGFSGTLTTPVVTSSLELTETLGRDLRAIVDNILGK